MLNLLLSILFSAALLLIFRLYPRFGVHTFQAIAVNYLTCMVLGMAFLPASFTENFGFSGIETFWLVLTGLLGCGFMLNFNLTGLTTQRVGVTVASLATNLSLVVPVGFSLLVLGNGSQSLHAANYAGLLLALVAIGLASVKKRADLQTEVTGLGAALLPLAVFLLSGAVNALTNYLSSQSVVPEAVFAWLAFGGAALAGTLALAVQFARGQERFHPRSVLGGVVLGVANYLSYLFLIRALRDFAFNGALLFPLYNVGVILLAAGVAVFGFGERLSLLNKIGLGLAVLALGLLII
ncbi:MAG: EamA/RhaT family transporter [Cytophagaceae bacterium]|nr:EamA/RhaT family transporter [Cytophagaceae bacterium]